MSNFYRSSRTCYILGGARLLVILGLLLVCFVKVGDVLGQKQVAQNTQPSQGAKTGVSQGEHGSSNREIVIAGRTLHVPDVWVVTQDGKKKRFYSDLIKDKSVAVGFFFTSCSFVCTWHGELFSGFQKHLAARLGKEVALISVSMDPITDTPARLKRWGARYGRRAGWTLVTGRKAEMNELLKSLTGDTIGPKEAHSSFLYIYNGKTGTWSYMLGTPTAADFEKQIEELGNRRAN